MEVAAGAPPEVELKAREGIAGAGTRWGVSGGAPAAPPDVN
jgi:hypothetical protein